MARSCAFIRRAASGGKIADVVSIHIVHLLEPVQVDVINPKIPACWRASSMHRCSLVQRKAIVDVGKLIELRAVEQIGVDAPRLDGQQASALPWPGPRLPLVARSASSRAAKSTPAPAGVDTMSWRQDAPASASFHEAPSLAPSAISHQLTAPFRVKAPAP